MPANPSPSDHPFVHRREVSGCDELMDLVKGGHGEFVQLGAGRGLGDMMRVELGGLHVFFAEISNTTHFYGVSSRNFRVVSVPIRWKDRLIWNGAEISHPGALIWAPSCEFSRKGTDVVIATLIVENSCFEATLSRWTGRERVNLDRLQGIPLADTPRSHRLICLLERIGDLARNSPGVFDHLPIRDQMRHDILAALFLAAEATPEWAPIPDCRQLRRSRVVSAAMDSLHEEAESNLTLLDLCERAGVGARTLENSFREIVGESPMRFLRTRQLHEARRLLRETSNGMTTVGECAYAVGITHLGRFSVAYRNRFGESPSETRWRALSLE